MGDKPQRLPKWLCAAIGLILALSDMANAAGPVAIHYGAAAKNVADLYLPDGAKSAPLILFIHGGGWSAGSMKMGEGSQPRHFTAAGYAWATINYRFVPDVRVEDQAADVAGAIAYFRKHAHRLKIDPDRIVLIGHSSGAHLAALIGTDPQWLQATAVPMNAVRGVVSLDGAGIDVPGIMRAGADASPFYSTAFGADVARQRVLSPTAHMEAPNVANWLLLFDGSGNRGAGYFGEIFAEGINAQGGHAQNQPIPNTTHMRMLNELGKDGDAATALVDRFLAEVLSAGDNGK